MKVADWLMLGVVTAGVGVGGVLLYRHLKVQSAQGYAPTSQGAAILPPAGTYAPSATAPANGTPAQTIGAVVGGIKDVASVATSLWQTFGGSSQAGVDDTGWNNPYGYGGDTTIYW